MDSEQAEKFLEKFLDTTAESAQLELPIPNPPVRSAKPPMSYQQRLRKMNMRQLCGELQQFIPGTRANRKRAVTPDTLSIAFATVLEAFVDGHRAGRLPYIR